MKLNRTAVFLAVFLMVFLSSCAAKRVLVKHDTCQPEPGKSGQDNCELLMELP